MQLSEWQLERLRDALRNFHSLNSASDGSRYNWNDVVEAIDLTTGVRVPYESLRKFVVGVRETKRKHAIVPDRNIYYRYQIPADHRLKAIYDFVTHPEVDLLSVEELSEREINVQAALRLLEYLEQDFDGERIMPPDDIEGRYCHCRDEAPFEAQSELTISKPMASGVMKAHLVERLYEQDVAPPRELVLGMGMFIGHHSEARFNGWAVMTPEDNFFIFLKEERGGKNRYYFTLATDLDYSGQIKIKKFSLLYHDYPLEPTDEDLSEERGLNAITRRIARNHHSFVRVGKG